MLFPASRALAVVCSIGFAFGQAEAQAPVLRWSASAGEEVRRVIATAVAVDGSIYTVAETAVGNPALGKTAVWAAKLSADGMRVQCSYTLGESDSRTSAAALGAGGTLLLAGSGFLARVDVCGQRMVSSIGLPSGIIASAVTESIDGTVYVAGRPLDGSDGGVVLQYDSGTATLLSRAELDGTPASVATDGAGRVYVTGRQTVKEAFLARYAAGVAARELSVAFGGGGPVLMGFEVAPGEDGSAWVAAAGLPGGGAVFGPSYGEGEPLPAYDGMGVALARIGADGAVGFVRFVDLPGSTVANAGRRPLGVARARDGRVWLAITGTTGFPMGLPLDTRTPVNGVFLRSFDSAGQPMGTDVIVPAMRSYTPLPAVAFGANGRVAAVSLTPYLPVTPGAARGTGGAPLSVVAFDLDAVDAPVTISDVDVLSLDQVTFGLARVTYPKAVELSVSDGSAREFAAAVVPDGDRGIPPPQLRRPSFAVEQPSGTMPASLRISTVDDALEGGILVVLTPGAQGITSIPIRLRRWWASLAVAVQDRFDLPGPSDELRHSSVAITADAEPLSGIRLNIPFQIRSKTPWLTLQASEGTTPAKIGITVDPSGLATGSHTAQLEVVYGDGAARSISVPVSIGPLIRVTGLASEIPAPYGKFFTHSFTVTSSGAPVEVTVEPRESFLQVSPAKGVTPFEVTVGFDAAFPVGRVFGMLLLRSPGSLPAAVALNYRVTPAQATFVPDSVTAEAAPGGLLNYRAGTSRCEPVQAQAPPWPLTAGGCTLRFNGAPIPIKGIGEGRLPPVFNFFETEYGIRAQLPYDIEAGPAELELEDRNGKVTKHRLTIRDVLPLVTEVDGARLRLTPLMKRPGEEIAIKLEGTGKTDLPLAAGSAAGFQIGPAAPVKAWVGGRQAAVLSAEMSQTEPGVLEVRIETPALPSDSYPVSIGIGAAVVHAGPVVINR